MISDIMGLLFRKMTRVTKSKLLLEEQKSSKRIGTIVKRIMTYFGG